MKKKNLVFVIIIMAIVTVVLGKQLIDTRNAVMELSEQNAVMELSLTVSEAENTTLRNTVDQMEVELENQHIELVNNEFTIAELESTVIDLKYEVGCNRALGQVEGLCGVTSLDWALDYEEYCEGIGKGCFINIYGDTVRLHVYDENGEYIGIEEYSLKDDLGIELN